MSIAGASAPAQGAEARSDPGAEARVNLLVLCLLALAVGLATGLGAVALRALIALIHNLCFKGTVSAAYDANMLEGLSPFGDAVALAPVLGGLLVVFIVERFAPEAKGHGVPEVMDSVFYKRGDIRGQVAVVKSLASALSIGSGAAVGREGPIIQIGSALGSAFARALGLATSQKITLLAAGAGAGIAATFNTPLGGVIFALEILLPEVSNRTFLPVTIATGAATLLGRMLIGPAPAFAVPPVSVAHTLNVAQVLAYVTLGGLVGLGAAAFIRLLVVLEDGFPKIPGGPYVQNAIAMGALGLGMLALGHAFGHYYIDGVGYGVIQAVLDGRMAAPGLLALLFLAKLAATCLSLGGGASGGVFSPSLYLGATLGGAFAIVVGHAWPQAALDAPSAAIIGMAAMVGASTGGVLTAIVMIFEMTRDYEIIVPVIAAVAVAAGVRRLLSPETIYTVKLRHRGHRIPKERHANLYLVAQARDVMERGFARAEAGARLCEVLAEEPGDLAALLVEREGRIVGLAPFGYGRWGGLAPDAAVESLVEPHLVVALDTDPLSRVLARLKRHRAGAAVVYSGGGRPLARNVVGVLTKRRIADVVIDNFVD